MDDQQFVTTLTDAIPDGMEPVKYARIPLAADVLEREGAVQWARERIVRQLGEEPDVMLLFDREQAEWLFSESLPSMGADDRMMIALTLRAKEVGGRE